MTLYHHVLRGRMRVLRTLVPPLLSTFLCLVAITSVPGNARAQDATVSKTEPRPHETIPDRFSKYSDRFDYWRTRYGSTPRLEAFINRLSKPVNTLSRPASPRVGRNASKGSTTATLFDDMQQLPDQSLENSRGFGSPVLIALPGNIIGMAYTDQGVDGVDFYGPPEIGPRVLFRTSSDMGETWTDPVVVADNADFILDYLFLSIAMTDAGRLVIIDETPYDDNHAFYSDDMGANWTEFAYDETDYADRVLGPVNGSLWLQDGNRSFQTSVQYRASDDGENWGSLQTMLATVPDSTELIVTDIARTGETSYVAAFSIFTFGPCCSDGIGVSTSSDNGATWSPVTPLTVPDGISPGELHIDNGSDGTLHAAFQGTEFTETYGFEDILTTKSTDGGATFEPATMFTSYAGPDYNPTQVVMDNTALVAFASDRGTMNASSRVWYGLADVTPDASPPPVVLQTDAIRGWLPAGRMFPLPRFTVYDESGIVSVEAHLSQGESEEVAPLFDDGEHNDDEADDGVYGGDVQMPGIDYGPDVSMVITAEDDDGNTAYGYVYALSVAALHDVGDLVTAVSPEGAMGIEFLQDGWPPVASLRYPKTDGLNFLYYGGLWIGINAPPGKRVSHLFYDNGYGPNGPAPKFGDWQVTEYPTQGPGESVLDVTMHYDDSGAPNPMGLTVQQTTYQWEDASYIIFDYVVTNPTNVNLSGLYAAMALDVDMPIEGSAYDDVIGYDADRAMIYAFDSGEWCAENIPEVCTNTHVGLALLGDGIGKSASTPHTATRWNLNADPVRSEAGLDPDMYDLMTSGIWAGFNLGLTTSPDEWRMLLTAQPFDLEPNGGSQRIVFGLVAAPGKDALLASADAMAQRFETAVLAVDQTDPVPREFALKQNYPNPFNPSTTIPFSIESASDVTLTVFDVLGREVERIVDEKLRAGSYTATFESSSLPSGAYFYTLSAGGKSITKSMFLLK